MTTVEEARARLAEIELAMLRSEVVEPLRPVRDAALAELREAEAAEARRRERLRRLPPSEATLELLWEDYQDLRVLGRSKMSAAGKSRAIRKFGWKLCRALPW